MMDLESIRELAQDLVIAKWDKVFQALGQPGEPGEFKADACVGKITSLHKDKARLDWVLANCTFLGPIPRMGYDSIDPRREAIDAAMSGRPEK